MASFALIAAPIAAPASASRHRAASRTVRCSFLAPKSSGGKRDKSEGMLKNMESARLKVERAKGEEAKSYIDAVENPEDHSKFGKEYKSLKSSGAQGKRGELVAQQLAWQAEEDAKKKKQKGGIWGIFQ